MSTKTPTASAIQHLIMSWNRMVGTVNTSAVYHYHTASKRYETNGLCYLEATPVASDVASDNALYALATVHRSNTLKKHIDANDHEPTRKAHMSRDTKKDATGKIKLFTPAQVKAEMTAFEQHIEDSNAPVTYHKTAATGSPVPSPLN